MLCVLRNTFSDRSKCQDASPMQVQRNTPQEGHPYLDPDDKLPYEKQRKCDVGDAATTKEAIIIEYGTFRDCHILT